MKKKDRAQHFSDTAARGSGNPTMAMISGMGLGAGIMYVLDPDRGRRRRAMAQQKAFRLLRQAGDAVDKGIRDLEHRSEGVLAEVFSRFHPESVPDDVLAQRVRSKLGRVACHPSSIEVTVQNGMVALSGPVLRGEHDDIARAVRQVRGVHRVECRLEEHDASENVPGLQGRSLRPGDRPELLQENWAPGTRLVMGAIGTSLLARSVRRHGLLSTVGGIVGIGLLTRAARRSRLLDSLMDALKPVPGPRAGYADQRGAPAPIESGVRTAGLGRRDEVGRSGVYPISGPLPPGPAEVRPAASFGQGERGAAGFEDHGTSEMTYTGGQVLGALSQDTSFNVDELLKPRDVPREQWLAFCNQLSKSLVGHSVTVQVRDGDTTRTEQRNLPLQGISADLKDRENVITVTVGHDGRDEVTHLINPRRLAVRDSGQNKLVEIEAADGPVTVIRFRAADIGKIIAA